MRGYDDVTVMSLRVRMCAIRTGCVHCYHLDLLKHELIRLYCYTTQSHSISRRIVEYLTKFLPRYMHAVDEVIVFLLLPIIQMLCAIHPKY